MRRRANLLIQLEERLLQESSHPLPLPLRYGLSILALIYRLLYELDRLPYRLGLRKPVRAGIPVIAVGNLAVGGTGKTPFTAWLAGALQTMGRHPAILAHSYKGAGRAPVIVDGAAAGGSDEARLLTMLCPGVPVIAGRDRTASAALADARFQPGVLVADDAFQHWRLARDLDLVLLDAAAPLGNGRLLPRGWLREPPSALRRADALILVGSDDKRHRDLPPLPIFRARVCPVSLTGYEEWRRGMRWTLGTAPREAAIFCGLAKPRRFLETLAALGVTITDQLCLADHTLPEEAEFRSWLAGGSYTVITTEKDAIKLTPELLGFVGASGRELLVLGIELRPEDEEGLLAFILDRLENCQC